MMMNISQKHSKNDVAARFAWLTRGVAALVAVAVLSGFSSVARASCGDWLADPNHKMAGQHSMMPSQDGTLPGPAPCKGPLCQKAPAAPSPAVPATAFEQVDRLGVAADT